MRYGYILTLAFALSMWSCSDGERSQSPDGSVAEEVVKSITVSRSAFARAAGEEVSPFQMSDANDGDVSSKDNWRYNTPDNMLPGGDNNEFTDKGVLFISQITPTRTPNIPVTEWTWFQGHPDERYWETDAGKKLYTGNDNLWMYELDRELGNGADWDKGYNFVPMFGENDEEPFKNFKMDWKTIKSYGSLGNAFSFFAMYYPGGNPIFQTYTHQSACDLAMMKRMDIMGAYHTTPSLYTRMRFKLYHLMVYVRVTVYVPVMEITYKDGEAIGYTGFGRNAFDENTDLGKNNGRPAVYITGHNTWDDSKGRTVSIKHSMDWRANRSSDEAPLVQASNESKAILAMHRHATFGQFDEQQGFTEKNVDGEWGHYLPDMPADEASPEVFEIDRSIFMTVPSGENPVEKVRRYEFSAIMVPQSIGKGSNLLVLRLATPGLEELPPDLDNAKKDYGTYKDFSFDGTSVNLRDNNGQLTLTQGTLQHFYIYIPRTGNKTILMKANVEPWKGTQTDMTVVEEEPEKTED